MLRFTTLFNFGLVGVLLVPAALQKGSTTAQLEKSLVATDQALTALAAVQQQLNQADYSGVDAIMGATEAPFGGERQRTQLLDDLRREIGELETQVQRMEAPAGMQHLHEDPTEGLVVSDSGTKPSPKVATSGLSTEELTQVGNVWPPVPESSSLPTVRKIGERSRFEKDGFTVDAVRQGRAYYRAERYTEALRLFQTRADEPAADYWIGRTLERLKRPQEAVAAYTKVIENEKSGPLAQRAQDDRDDLMWLIDFDRKVADHKKLMGGGQ